MTGNYPDPPGPRMAYDKDGSQGYLATVTTLGSVSAITRALTATEMADLNDENLALTTIPDAGGYNSNCVILIFPQLRDLIGVFGYFGNNVSPSMQVSPDTTNGIDGTWSAPGLPDQSGHSNVPSMRTAIAGVSASGIKAVRFFAASAPTGTTGWHTIHLYGEISAGASPDRLSFWHPALDQSLALTPAYFDWGDRPRNTSATKDFRIKNRSTTLTASTITVGVEALTDPSPSIVGMHSLSADGTTFASTLSIASLAPGEISPVLTVKQDISASAALSLWNQRLYATVGGWA